MSHFCTRLQRRIVLVAAVYSCLVCIHAYAVTTSWNSNANGNFTTLSNWTSGVPGSADTAEFNRGSGVTYTVTFPGGSIFDPPPSYVLNYLRVRSNSVTFRDNSSAFVTAPNLTVANAGVSIVIGEFAGEVAALTTSLSSFTGANASIGRDPGANGTLNVSAGTFSLTGELYVGDYGTGTLNVAGGGSASNTGIGYIAHFPGSTGAATVSGPGSTWVNGKALGVGVVGTGTLRIEAGGNVSSSTFSTIGSASGSTGTATVTGIGSKWTVSGNFLVGDSGQGTLRIEAGGSVSSAGGYLGANAGSSGAVTVSGASSKWTNSSGLNVGYNINTIGTLSIEAGGGISNTTCSLGGLGGSTGTATVNGAGSTWVNSGNFTVGDYGQGMLTIAAGGSVSVGGVSTIGFESFSAGTVTVTGAGSTWTNSDQLIVGRFGTGTLTIQSGGSVSSQGGCLGCPSFGNSGSGIAIVTGANSAWTNSSDLIVGYYGTGALTIEDGGSVSNVNSSIGASSSGTVTVTGAGATWNVGGSSYVGNVSGTGGVGVLTVQTGGTVNIGQDLVLYKTGTVNLQGGQINLVSGTDLIFSGGTFNFSFGTLHFTTSQAIGASGPIETALGGERRLRNGQHLEIDGTLTLNAPFQIDGGRLEADSLAVNSDLLFTAGMLEVRGGPITGLTSLTVPSNGELRTSGVHSFRVTGAAGSTITATGNLTLGNAAAVNGFGTQGTLQVGSNTVTLLDANDVVFDSLSLVTLGSGASPGTLTAANGMTLDLGGNITGFGTISSTNTLAKRSIVNGSVEGSSAAQPITFTGWIKGLGSFNNASFTGTFDPGLSTTITSAGNLALTSTSTLIMELGGTTPGSGHDQINASGSLVLGGTLLVSMVNGYSPASGQAFDLFNWSTQSGVFGNLNLPALASGLQWNTSQLYTTGVLSVASVGLPGDFNNNGIVDAADYVVWRKGLGTIYTQNDYSVWRAHFGQSAPGSGPSASVNATVPEPTTLALLMFAAAGWCLGRRRAA